MKCAILLSGRAAISARRLRCPVPGRAWRSRWLDKSAGELVEPLEATAGLGPSELCRKAAMYSRRIARAWSVISNRRQVTITVMVMSLELVMLPEASLPVIVNIVEYVPLEGTLQLKSTETS